MRLKPETAKSFVAEEEQGVRSFLQEAQAVISSNPKIKFRMVKRFYVASKLSSGYSEVNHTIV